MPLSYIVKLRGKQIDGHLCMGGWQPFSLVPLLVLDIALDCIAQNGVPHLRQPTVMAFTFNHADQALKRSVKESQTWTRKRQYVSYSDFHMCDNPATKESGTSAITIGAKTGSKSEPKVERNVQLWTSPLRIKSSFNQILFIREEYELAHNTIVTGMSPEERVIFLFVGQPGTSLWAYHTVHAATNRTR